MLKIVKSYYCKLCDFGMHWLLPILLLLERICMTEVFWYSGIVKITDWEATLYLFEHEYKVPCFSPAVAACSSTILELVCSVLLLLGFATRFATLPLLGIVAMIQYVYPAEINVYWALLLSTILICGPGFISVDALLQRWFLKSKS